MPITNGLITRAEFEQFTTYTTSSTDRQAMEDMSIETASRAIEAYCGRQFYDSVTPSIRYFDSYDAHRFIADDFQSVTLLRSDTGNTGTFDLTWTTDMYQLLAVGGRTRTLGAVAYTGIRTTFARWFPIPVYRVGLIELTARWGWTAVPTPVKRACMLLALDILRGPEAAFGATTGDFGVLRVKEHPQVEKLLQPFVRYDSTVGIA